jgi:hypothetical protein
MMEQWEELMHDGGGFEAKLAKMSSQQLVGE